LDKQRAIAIIADAYRESGQPVAGSRVLLLPSGRALRVDVGAAGHQYGVAYLTVDDMASLDPSRDLPPAMQSDDLPLVQGAGPDADAVVLVLYSANYLSIDSSSRQPALPSASEQKLSRDVRDFLVQARAQRLP
jgi:hypothetical protein